MKPILYASITEGTVPSDYGAGVLSDCLACTVKEERNGAYELEMEYAAQGIHAGNIVPNAILKVKPNYTDDPQLFRIYKVDKTINGRFAVYAQHISYDLSGKVITSGTAENIQEAVELLTSYAGQFSVQSTKGTAGVFRITEPSSVRSWFGGKQGSLLDVYGSGEWHYDNFIAKLWVSRGADRGVTIRYGKNLTELSQEIDMSNLVSGVVPYYKDSEGNVTTGSEVSTGLTIVDRSVAVDFSENIDPESIIPVEEQLQAQAEAYISSNEHNLTRMLNSITLSFVQLQGMTERIDLCDTVNIYFEALGISASMKCISTTWDVLKERYTETEFGDAKTNIADTILNTSATAIEANETADSARAVANSKKRVFTDTPVPPYDVGDMWVTEEGVMYCANPKAHGEEYELSDWLSALETSISNASDLICGGTGGNVIIMRHEDGTPYEIVIADKPDLSEADNVWRWNENGLAYSSDGYHTPTGYINAFTKDGFNASLIKTGNLDADNINVLNLTAKMFKSSKIKLGGENNGDGVLELYDDSGALIGQLTKEGLKFYGDGPEGHRPYVVLNNNDGFKGFDANGNALFWVSRDEFVMTKCVAQNEISACGKIRFLPMEIEDSNNQVINNGIAFVGIVEV